MNAIVSVTQDWGIGYKGNLLVRNREDMRFFREHTMGGTVLCGRTTFESFPGGALKGRENVVLTRDMSYSPAGATVVHSPEEAMASLARHDPDDVWLIGGAEVYRQLLPHCTRAYVTMHRTQVPADAFFPNLDEDPQWTCESELPWQETSEGIPFSFRTYVRNPMPGN